MAWHEVKILNFDKLRPKWTKYEYRVFIIIDSRNGTEPVIHIIDDDYKIEYTDAYGIFKSVSMIKAKKYKD